MTSKNIFISFILSLLVWAEFSSAQCIRRKGALDIGSGSTKAYAAVVDVCKKKILEKLFDEQIPLGFGQAREKNPNNEIPQEFVTEASGKIKQLLQRMRSKYLTSVSAVATAAFRAARNGPEVANELSQSLEIPVKILSQEEEARLGAESALSNLPGGRKSRQIIVWDIGGGSMQMWAPTPEGPKFFLDDLASVTFKNKIIRDLQTKDIQKFSSPNPLSKVSVKAVAMAENHARERVPEFFKEQGMNARWIGIGGVLKNSIQRQVGSRDRQFRRAQLEKALKTRAPLSDKQIGGDYRETEVSNLALVLGYMKALRIYSVETLDASLAQGWILRQP